MTKKLALVTGGSRGIGAEIAKKLQKMEMKLLLAISAMLNQRKNLQAKQV